MSHIFSFVQHGLRFQQKMATSKEFLKSFFFFSGRGYTIVQRGIRGIRGGRCGGREEKKFSHGDKQPDKGTRERVGTREEKDLGCTVHISK